MTARESADVAASLQSLGISAEEYVCRHRRARRSMTEMQRKLFDAIVIDDKTVQQAARELGLTNDAALHDASKALCIHYYAIAAPPRPWWRIW